ncbi:MAG: toxin-antitoxin system antitoxin component protein [Candidatus Scalindua rubra]|uniref:Toxin-antitoxin system antitoxin component protein n=1 Tax=Candidatus Scalindua rubra TaxID=1872076 RepID=A0A1E3X6S3_9BACT|nr:MAG: toxin-antitoxin system antitoxin component protein [Candidatus Scalindua rubra]
MQLIGIRELKNRLTYYLSLIKKGENVVVTDRGNPIAIIHSLPQIDTDPSPAWSRCDSPFFSPMAGGGNRTTINLCGLRQ